MEKSILITSSSKLHYIKKEPSAYQRIYYGSEFCVNRVPTAKELESFLLFCEKYNKEFTLVTPYLTEKGIEKVKVLLNFLDEKQVYPEILISDWGMLNYIPEKFGNKFPLILGRITAKQKTGPRIETIKDINPTAFKSSMKSHVDIPQYLNFLIEKNVQRIELDIPLQGMDLKLPKDCEIFVSFYYPYGYISTTRRCPLQLTGECSCEDNYFRLASKQMPVPLYCRGNTVFFKHEEFPKIPAIPQYNRIVYEPEVP